MPLPLIYVALASLGVGGAVGVYTSDALKHAMWIAAILVALFMYLKLGKRK